jgi:hypothetical protein
MTTQYTRGQLVVVKVYGGEVVERRVVIDRGRSVVLCAEREYNTAQNEGQEPEGIGFPRNDVSATR